MPKHENLFHPILVPLDTHPAPHRCEVLLATRAPALA